MAHDNKDLFDFLEKIYELHINTQSGAIDSIEAKAGQILAGIGIFLPIALAIIANSTKISFNGWIIAGCLTSLLCIIYCSVVLWAKQFKIRPKISEFYDDTKDLLPEKMRMVALLDMHTALEVNKEPHCQKGKAFNIAVFLFCSSVLLISCGIIVQNVNLSYNILYSYTKPLHEKEAKKPSMSTTRPTQPKANSTLPPTPKQRPSGFDQTK